MSAKSRGRGVAGDGGRPGRAGLRAHTRAVRPPGRTVPGPAVSELITGLQFRHPRYVAHQVYYSLIGRDYEWELMPLALDQGVGAVVWSPLGWGRLTGKVRRGEQLPEGSRLHQTAEYGPPVDDEHLYRVMDVLDEIAEETGKTVPQIAINWLLQRPTVSSVIVGARNEAQLRQNLGAVGWTLSPDQMSRLDGTSAKTAPYPYFPYYRQEGFARLNPPVPSMRVV